MALATETTTPTIAGLEPIESLDALAGEWNTIAGDVPFRSHEWLATWWRHFGGGSRRLFTLALRDEEQRLVGLAPWYLDWLPGRGQVVRFLGSGHVCSDYLSVLCHPGYERAVATKLAEWLSGPAADAWDLLEFSGVAADDAPLTLLCQRLSTGGYATYRRADTECWRTQLPEDWDTFLAGLSSSRRQRTRMLLRRNFEQGPMALRTVADEGQLSHGFRVLVDLHQQRRRSLGQAGCFASPGFTNFHYDVCRAFLAAGRLRLLWLEHQGRPIAVEYSLIGGDTVYYYQGGFDPAESQQRPGWLCFSASLKRAIAEGYRAYDFLRGNEAYKASWRAESRPLVQLRVVGRRGGAPLRHAVWRTGEKLKGLIRQWKSDTRTLSADTSPE